ncbi:MAG: hypothetical protein A3J38_03270 [Gammaproteobacteria bacterium RIFCSPHIGHO2_12_FULL_45_9]|nr:MAG: hypothetical protein A3J38_03270 [Gammaproteobacteria bacterium RIFCSPHIGHO2_12_FULL_45_9]
MKRHLLWILTGLLLFMVISIGVWRHLLTHPSTDDAYVNAYVITLAPRVSGQVLHVYVTPHQYVTKGTLLFELDPAPYLAAYQQAEANLINTGYAIAADDQVVAAAHAALVQRQAELLQTQRETKRTLSLESKGFVSHSEADVAKRTLTVSEANVASAQDNLAEAIQKRGSFAGKNPRLSAAAAALETARLNLQYTHVYAPANGFIENDHLWIGTALTAYQTALSLVDNHIWWIDANYKETDVGRIKPGQLAKITLDMYPGVTFQGKVISISRGSGDSFSLLPPENASGNWVKITQRFPVRIELTPIPAYPFRIGASGNVSIDTTRIPTH